MNLFAWIASVTTALFKRSYVSDEMQEELDSHIQLRADDLERSGMTRREAERRARVEFGGVARFKDQSYEATGGAFFERLMQDVRFGLRMLRKSPGFSVVAILTLAFGVGANTMAFSILNGLVLRPNNLPLPRNLYMVEEGTHHFEQSYPDYLDMRDRSRAFEGVLAFNFAPVGIDSGSGSTRALTLQTTGNYFDVLGVQPFLGRFFHGTDEHGPDSVPYVVLSYDYWQAHFQGDRGIVGRTVKLNKYPFTVLGVGPPAFRGTALFFIPDMWTPVVNQAQIEGIAKLTDRRFHDLWIVGRVRPGVTKKQLVADLDSLAKTLEREHPKEDDALSFVLARPELMGDYIGAATRAFVTGLMLLAGLILLAACANLGSLFSARAADRSKEIALRLALGSSRKRIMRQLLTEAVMIALAGGTVGLVGSVALLNWLSAWRPVPGFPVSLPVSPDTTVYVVAVLLALVSGVLFGMVPVRQVLRSNPYEVIKASASGISRRLNFRDVLLAVQISICAVLVTASLVAVRGLMRSLHESFGIQIKNVMLVRANLTMARYSAEQQPIMQRRMLEAVERIPGVTAAAYGNSIPLDTNTTYFKAYADSTTDLKDSNAAVQMTAFDVSEGYFRTAGTALLAGREFTLQDDKDAPQVAVVNAEFARKVFGSVEKAMGGHFKLGDGKRIEVVGVAEDGKYINLNEDRQAAMFRPILQVPSSLTWLVVRSERDPQQLTEALLRSLHELDPGLLLGIRTWRQTMEPSFFPARVAAISLGALGALGALLSVTGVFGMAAYSVSKRLREFGIRIALGAQRREVLQAALGRTFRLLAMGSAAGLLLGLPAGKVLAFIVYKATPWDPIVLGGVVLTMLTLGLVAGWIPARRALATDPLILLREE